MTNNLDVQNSVTSLQKYYMRESENVQEALDKIEQDRFSKAFIEVFEVLQDVANRLLNSDTSLGLFTFGSHLSQIMEITELLHKIVNSEQIENFIHLVRIVDASKNPEAPPLEILSAFDYDRENNCIEIPSILVDKDGHLKVQHESVARLLHSQNILPERLLHSLPEPNESEIMWVRKHDSDYKSKNGKKVGFNFKSLFGN